MSWKYSDRVNPGRQAMLLNVPDFNAIVIRILGEVKIIAFDVIRGTLGELETQGWCFRAQWGWRPMSPPIRFRPSGKF